MTQNSKIKKIMNDADLVKADDPNMIKKLEEIARMVAEQQGKVISKSQKGANTKIIDPAEELGCEGCQ